MDLQRKYIVGHRKRQESFQLQVHQGISKGEILTDQRIQTERNEFLQRLANIAIVQLCSIVAFDLFLQSIPPPLHLNRSMDRCHVLFVVVSPLFHHSQVSGGVKGGEHSKNNWYFVQRPLYFVYGILCILCAKYFVCRLLFCVTLCSQYFVSVQNISICFCYLKYHITTSVTKNYFSHSWCIQLYLSHLISGVKIYQMEMDVAW